MSDKWQHPTVWTSAAPAHFHRAEMDEELRDFSPSLMLVRGRRSETTSTAPSSDRLHGKRLLPAAAGTVPVA